MVFTDGIGRKFVVCILILFACVALEFKNGGISENFLYLAIGLMTSFGGTNVWAKKVAAEKNPLADKQ